MSVPKLRFKEFGGIWKQLHLGAITQTITSGSRDWAQYYSVTGSKFIRMTNLNRDGIQLKLDDLRFVNVESDSSDGQRTSLSEGDILISITAELGKIGWIPPGFGEAYINQHTALVRLKNSDADSRFIAHLLSTSKQNKQLNQANDSGAKAGLNLPTIKKIGLNVPAVPEQTKIANFLTAVDEKITQLTQKCDLLTQYKKGVMLQIFSQKLRFKDDEGKDFPEWNEKPLGNIATRVRRKNSQDNQNVLTISAQQGLINQQNYFKKSVAAKDLTNYYLLYRGDFAYNKSYSNGYPMGAIKKLNIYEKGVVSTLYIVFRFNDGNLDTFFEHYFESGCHNLQLEKIAHEGARNHGLLNIGVDDFFETSLMLPCLDEQTKIANFLTSIDEKIINAQAQLASAKQYKQGLLQQMFV